MCICWKKSTLVDLLDCAWVRKGQSSCVCRCVCACVCVSVRSPRGSCWQFHGVFVCICGGLEQPFAVRGSVVTTGHLAVACTPLLPSSFSPVSSILSQAVRQAKVAGVHLIFLSGNEIFWRVEHTDNLRTLVCYKRTFQVSSP